MLSSKIVSSKLNFSNKRSYSATTSSLKESLTNYSLSQVGQVQNSFANHNNGEVTVSKLSNGVTVISKNGNGVNTSFGLFVKAGSAYETPSTAGASSFLRRSALKSTANTSGLRVARYIQSLTSEFNVQNGRETIEYHVDFLRSDSENVGTFLSEILHPRLAEWEVRDTKDELTKELAEEKCLYSRIKNALYFQGYKGQGVGRPLSSPNNLDNIDQQILRNYASKFLRNAAGVSLVGVGIDHASLVTAAEAFSSLKADKNSLEVKSTYFGGEHFEEDLSLHSTSLVVAFPIAKEHSIPLRVISHVLGAGNIKKGRTDVGDGVNSRFGSLVLSNSNVSSAKAFVLDSANGGGNFPFFGVSGNAQFGNTAALQSALVSELSKLEGSLNDADISRAKNLAKLQFASQLEDKSSLKNLLYYNQVNPVDQFAKIDAVSLADVKSVLKNALNANPTVVCIGDLTGLSSVKL